MSEMINRFSPEFAAKLRKKVGDIVAFKRARDEFMRWRTEDGVPIVISPFCAHYVPPARFDYAECGRDLTTEYYEGPFTHEPVLRPYMGVFDPRPMFREWHYVPDNRNIVSDLNRGLRGSSFFLEAAGIESLVMEEATRE